MNKICRTVLLLVASAGVSFVLINTWEATTASANVGQSLLSPMSTGKVPSLKADALGDSGQIEDVSWSLTDGVLTISGGTINSRPGPYPWAGGKVTKINITGPLVLKGNAPEKFFLALPNVDSIDGLSNLDISDATSVKEMFGGDTNIKNIDWAQIKTGNLTTMESMFYNSGFTKINLTGMDTHNVTNMSRMFNSASNLTEINLGNIDTSQVTTMHRMFINDTNLSDINFRNIDTKSVTDMSGMFQNDAVLSTLDFSKIPSFDTSNVSDMSSMFADDSVLTTLNVSTFNTGNVEDMHEMFAKEPSITSLDLTNFNTSNVTTSTGMFSQDLGLTSLDLSSFDLRNAYAVSGMLKSLENLQRITLGQNTILIIPTRGLTNASLGAPAGGDEWQAIASGTITNPAGAKFTPDALMALYTPDQTRPAKETYVVPGQTDKSAFDLVAAMTIPVGGTFDPTKVFASATTPEGTPITNWNDAIGAGLTVTGADFNTNTPGQYKVTFKFAGSDKTGTVIVTVGNGGGGGGSVTPPAPNPNPTPTPTPNPVPTPTPQPTPPTNPETPTIPGNVVKKQHAVYALKVIYLYKNPTFKKSQRMAAYPKQKRTNRPMFVVIGYGRSSNGTFRYKVRDVNHNRKSAGKIGFITANWKFVRGAYYQSVPKNKTITVISKKGVKAYKHQDLTGRLKFYKKGTRLIVKKIVTHNLTTRYLLSNGTYVTANKKLVIQGKY